MDAQSGGVPTQWQFFTGGALSVEQQYGLTCPLGQVVGHAFFPEAAWQAFD
jgi:hypothetical protein